MKTLKEKVKAGERINGTHIALGNIVLADAFAQMDYDFIWVDTEHSAIDYAELLQCVTVIKARGTAVVVRAHVNEPGHVKRILEMGVDGIVFPNLSTPEEMEDAIRSSSYPTRGYRGFGPLGAVNYGLDNLDDYIRSENKLCRFVQIENKTAVDNIEKIVQNKDIDGYIFGPCDLSGTIGKLNRIYDEENLALIRHTIDVIERAGGYTGISLGTIREDQQRFWMELGCKMVSAGTDYDYAVQAALANAKQMRRLANDLG